MLLSLDSTLQKAGKAQFAAVLMRTDELQKA